MKGFYKNFVKVSLGTLLIFLILGFVGFILTLAGKLIAEYLFIFTDFLLTKHNVEPEMSIGIIGVFLFIVFPITVIITNFENYWKKEK